MSISIKDIKRLIGSLILSSFLVLVAGCNNDFLERLPEASSSLEDFFQDSVQLRQAVNGAYVPLRELTDLDYWVFNEMRSDNTTFQFNEQDRGLEQRARVDYFLIEPADDNSINNFWEKSYRGIERANVILAHLESLEEISGGLKQEFQGQAKFLRGFYYFNLVYQFGGVPLELEPTENPDEARSNGRSDKSEVVQSVVSDFSDAISLLPNSYSESERGRATADAARVMLAKTYMMEKKFDEAEKILREISGYSLLPEYKNVFDPNNKPNSEIIFAVQYSGFEEGLGSNFMFQFAPRESGNLITGDPEITSLVSDSGWNIPTRDMIRSYENGDNRMAVSLKEGYSANGSFVNQPFVNKYNFGVGLSGQTDVNFPTLRYADVILMLAECLNEQAFESDGEALHLVNEIRERAGLADLNSSDVSNQDKFRDVILHERRIELAFENHRWLDLIRYGKAVEIMNAHGEEEKKLRQNQEISSSAYQVTENKLLLPIPQRAVDVDDLEQNSR